MSRRPPHTPRAEGRPNVLILTCDQVGYPRFSVGPDAGFNDALNRILRLHRRAGHEVQAWADGMLALLGRLEARML